MPPAKNPNRLWILLLLIAIGLAGVVLYARQHKKQSNYIPDQKVKSDIADVPGYRAVDPTRFEVSVMAEDLSAPSRIKISPDGQYMLLSQTSGEVIAFLRRGNIWERQPNSLLEIDTGFTGFPPDEGGLLGIIFSTDYINNGRVFFLHTTKQENGRIKNRVSGTTIAISNDGLIASEPEIIFEANTDGSPAHQITDGLAVEVMGQPHLLILIGDGFQAEKAQDPTVELGKALLITESGEDPVGQSPRVVAVGVRNAYALAANPFDPTNRVLIADTGPEKFDRIIYTRLFQPNGTSQNLVNLGWNGVVADLENPIPDPNFPMVEDIVVSRLVETRTITGLAFHPGKGSITPSSPSRQSVLLTYFGQTGSYENSPGKKIFLGELTNLDGQPRLAASAIITRAHSASGYLGNPIGLEVDPQDGDFYFADILEGRLYRVKPL